MKKTFFLALTILALLASCSTDEMYGVKSIASANSLILSDSISLDSICKDSLGKPGRHHGGFERPDSLKLDSLGKLGRHNGGLGNLGGKGKHGIHDSLSIVVDSLRTRKPKGHDYGNNKHGGLPKDSLHMRK